MATEQIPRRRTRLNQRSLMLGLFGAAIAIVAVLDLLTIRDATRLALDGAQREIAAQARLVAVAHDRWLDESRAALHAVAAALRNTSQPGARCARFFADFVGRTDSFDTLLLVAPNGDLLCSAQPSGPHNFADRGYFQRAMETREFAVGDLTVGRVSRQGVLPVALPVLADSGEVEFLLVAGKQLDWIAGVVFEQAAGQHLQVTIVDGEGTVLARSPNAGLRERAIPEADVFGAILHRGALGIFTGALEGIGEDGAERLFGFTRLGDRGRVYALVSRPRADALGPIADFRDRSIANLAVATTLLFIILWWVLGRLILRPLSRLAEGMRRVQEGDLSWRSPDLSTTAEIGTISDSLNAMLTRLEDANARLRQLVDTDPLLGIANRRHFTQELEREWRREGRSRKALSVLMIDVDCFKAYNDTYGHQEGDRCLRRVTEAVKSECRRPGDLVARYGGEELVVILPETDRTGAREVAEKVRLAVIGAGIPHASSTVAPVVTVSVGVATDAAGDYRDAAALLGAADRALYRAKAAGRNQVAPADGSG